MRWSGCPGVRKDDPAKTKGEPLLCRAAGCILSFKGVPHPVMPCGTYTDPEGSQFYF